jgi:hypothetical protein
MKNYEILEGAIDLHMHPGPTRVPYRINFLEAAKEAAAAGMRAIVFKPLYFPTMDRAFAAEQSVSDLRVFGGIVLDFGMGGLNPQVVKNAIEMGAKFVWMPLFDSKHTIENLGINPTYRNMVTSGKNIVIVDEDDRLLPQVREILEVMVKSAGVILETSHLSPRESLALIEGAKRIGIQHVLVTHPLFPIIGATQDEICEMVRRGAIINHCVAACYPNPVRDALNPQKIAESIQDVGAEHCVLSTDLGGILFPSPLEGLRGFCEMMIAAGISKREIDIMIKENPAKILGLG